MPEQFLPDWAGLQSFLIPSRLAGPFRHWQNKNPASGFLFSTNFLVGRRSARLTSATMTGISSCKSRIRRNTLIRFHYGLTGIAVAAGLCIVSASQPARATLHGDGLRLPTVSQEVIAVDDEESLSATTTRKIRTGTKETTTTRTGARTAIGKITMAIGKTTIKIGAKTTTTRTGRRTGTRTGPITIITGTRTGTIMPTCATGITGPITGSSSAVSCSARSSRRPAWASCPTRPNPISAGTGPTRR